MLKFARRFKASSLVRADVPANLTKVASQNLHFYEYIFTLSFQFNLYLYVEFKNTKMIHWEHTSKKMPFSSLLIQLSVSTWKVKIVVREDRELGFQVLLESAQLLEGRRYSGEVPRGHLARRHPESQRIRCLQKTTLQNVWSAKQINMGAWAVLVQFGQIEP